MMPAVNPVKLPPLLHRQRPKNRMVQNLCPRTELALALIELRGHRINLCKYRWLNLLCGHSTRKRALRGFATGRKESCAQEEQCCQALRGCRSRGQRSSLLQASSESFRRILVSQKKVLENLGDAPPAFRIRSDAGRRCSVQGCSQFFLQTVEMRCHSEGSVTMTAKITQPKSYRTH